MERTSRLLDAIPHATTINSGGGTAWQGKYVKRERCVTNCGGYGVSDVQGHS